MPNPFRSNAKVFLYAFHAINAISPETPQFVLKPPVITLSRPTLLDDGKAKLGIYLFYNSPLFRTCAIPGPSP